MEEKAKRFLNEMIVRKRERERKREEQKCTGRTEKAKKRSRREERPKRRSGIYGARFMVEVNKAAGGSNTVRKQKFSCSCVRE